MIKLTLVAAVLMLAGCARYDEGLYVESYGPGYYPHSAYYNQAHPFIEVPRVHSYFVGRCR